MKYSNQLTASKKIGDKSSILSPITGFQTQNPFRKPSDSSPQGPATISNNSRMKASLRWRESIKTGSIGLRSKHHSPIPNITINYGKHCLFRTIRLLKHLLQVWLATPVIAALKTRLKQNRSNDQHSKHFVVWNVYVREIKS